MFLLKKSERPSISREVLPVYGPRTQGSVRPSLAREVQAGRILAPSRRRVKG
jgi:hypothetical protein